MIKIKIEDCRDFLKGPVQKKVFDFLMENEIATTKILSERLNINYATIHNALESLVKRGFINKQKNKTIKIFVYSLNKEVEG